MNVFIIIALCWIIPSSHAFLPASIESTILDKFDLRTRASLGEVSETLSHEKIISRGLLRSVARFFHDQPGGTTKINLTALDDGYYDTSAKAVYHAYYGKWLCEIDLIDLINLELHPNVALPDLEPRTTSLPYAHFDGETFRESNERVANFTGQVYEALDSRDYFKARVFSGQILHTIHDFYSHSSWLVNLFFYSNIVIYFNIFPPICKG
jgi:hypothetical protein